MSDPNYDAEELTVTVTPVFRVPELDGNVEFGSYEDAVNTAAVALGLGARFTVEKIIEVSGLVALVPDSALETPPVATSPNPTYDPVLDQTVPDQVPDVEEATTPDPSEFLPVGDPTPVVDPAPADVPVDVPVEDPAPVVEEPAPVVEDPTPVAEDPAPTDTPIDTPSDDTTVNSDIGGVTVGDATGPGPVDPPSTPVDPAPWPTPAETPDTPVLTTDDTSLPTTADSPTDTPADTTPTAEDAPPSSP